MSMGSPPNAACAACKFQRRKCTAECPLAPWFPPDQPKRFANVHKLFGVSNVLKLFSGTEDAKREDLIRSIVYEADARERDPVHGAYGTLQLLGRRETELERERDKLRRVYEAMLLEEAKQATQAVYLLQSNAPHDQLNTLGSMGSMGSMGALAPPYLEYSAGAGSIWNPSVPSAHASSKQPHQADWLPPYTYSGHGYGGNMYPNAQQLPSPSQHQQFARAAPQHQKFPSVESLQLHPQTTANGNSMMRSKSDSTPQSERDFLSQGLSYQSSFP